MGWVAQRQVTFIKTSADEFRSFYIGLFVTPVLVTIFLVLTVYFSPGRGLTIGQCLIIIPLISALPWFPEGLLEWLFGVFGLAYLWSLSAFIIILDTVMINLIFRPGQLTTVHEYGSGARRPSSSRDMSATDIHSGMSEILLFTLFLPTIPFFFCYLYKIGHDILYFFDFLVRIVKS